MLEGKVSPNFYRSEFECKCGCGFDAVDIELLGVLEDLRKSMSNMAIVISSGCRCRDHNTRVGGAKKSMHVLGKAVDILVVGYTPLEIYDHLIRRYPNKYGMGLYTGWVHIDVRSGIWRSEG